MRDPDVELALAAAASRSIPAPPVPPPELTKSGKLLTKRQKKEVRHFFQVFAHASNFFLQLKHITSGPDWFDLPAPSEADLPRLYREVEALRLRNQLDSKRFYKKDEGEGKGIKGLPKCFAVCLLFHERIRQLKNLNTKDRYHTPFYNAFRDSKQR